MAVGADQRAQVPQAVIRRRVDLFVAAHGDDRSEKSESQTFWNDFFAIFGRSRRQVAVFEQLAKRASTGGAGYIDLLYPGEMAVEQKSAGEDLDAAMQQVIDYLPSLSKAETPRLLVACDFQYFRWRDLEAGTSGTFALAELPENVELFTWLAGYPRSDEEFANEEDVNLKATALLARVHDRLAVLSYPEHARREWMTRILFLLFADDAEVWEPAAFHSWLSLHTRRDGRDLGGQLAFLFQLLNTPKAGRPANLDDALRGFEYINGDLFEEQLPIPSCDEEVREALLEACRFDWRNISPAIFGSMFQNVMTPLERRQLGAHYTTEENILRTIRPLFLDDLEAELVAATTKPALERFIAKVGSLTFFDPAAGCGNFLVITYRELRRLETEALRRLLKLRGKGEVLFDISLQLRVTVDQMYAIEIEEFPAKIARTALYLADHLANRKVSAEFGQHYVRFPIPSAPHITHGDALETDWDSVLPAADCDYCFGNPPFAGHTTRSKQQSDQMRAIWGKSYAKWLDYVTCWFRKAMDYGRESNTRFAFVATNSTSQGEQVARLWKPLLEAGYRIDFAHQTFAWKSEARGKAHVFVVVVGFSRSHPATRRLYTYPDIKGQPVESQTRRINPYLVDGPDIVAERRREPLSTLLPPVRYGNLASDGGHLVVKPEEVPYDDEVAMAYIRPFVGSVELVRGIERYCLWMPDGPRPGDLGKSPFIHERLQAVRDWRLTSKNPDTRALADLPYRFFFIAPQPPNDYLGIPATVSETRRWYTVARVPEEVITSNALYFADDADGLVFSLLSSSMFVAWQRAVGGALKSDLRFSGGVVYNTFPVPTSIKDEQRAAVIQAGRAVLTARPSGVSLVDAYAPTAMPAPLVKAHRELDRLVDRLFAGRKKVRDNNDRLSILMERYREATTPQPVPGAHRASTGAH